MKSYHEKLMDAVIKNVKEVPLLDEWFKGNTVVKFNLGATSGMYVGSSLLRSDAGGTINLDPSKITGVYFETIIREEDAELAFKGIKEKNQDLQADVARLRGELSKMTDQFQKNFTEMESEMAMGAEREIGLKKELEATCEREVLLHKKLQAYETDPGQGSSDTVKQPSEPVLSGPEGSEGFGNDTKKAAGISDAEKVTITKDDIGTLDAAALGLKKK
jgi:hypothetical protein